MEQLIQLIGWAAFVAILLVGASAALEMRRLRKPKPAERQKGKPVEAVTLTLRDVQAIVGAEVQKAVEYRSESEMQSRAGVMLRQTIEEMARDACERHAPLALHKEGGPFVRLDTLTEYVTLAAQRDERWMVDAMRSSFDQALTVFTREMRERKKKATLR